MGILLNIQKRFKNEILRSASTVELYNALSKKMGDRITLRIVPKATLRTREDIATWLTALRMAEHVENPKRQRLLDLYESVTIDNHLTSVMGNRKLKVKAAKFKIVSKDGKEDKTITELLEVPWFDEFLDHVIDSIFYGHSLIEFGELENKQFAGVTLVPRKHVRPEFGDYLVNETDDKGILYRGTELMNWLIEVGKPRNLGLLKKAAPMGLWKKNSFGAWSEFGEKFGIPLRTVTTPARDSKRLDLLEEIMTNMGSAGWAVLQDGEVFDIKASAGQDAWRVFDMLIERCNSEMSKLILHQTMTTDDGSSKSQAEVHEEVADIVHEADKTFVKYVINWKLFPLLITHGYPVKDKKFDWNETKEIPMEEQISLMDVLLNHYEIAPDWILANYNIPVLKKQSMNFSPEIQNKLEEVFAKLKKKSPAMKDEKHFCGGDYRKHFIILNQSELSENEINLVERLWNDTNPNRFDYKTFVQNHGELLKALKQGFGENAAEYNSPDRIAMTMMEANLNRFGFDKNIAQVSELNRLILEAKNFSEFKTEAEKLLGNFNHNWLKTEYDTAVSVSQNAANWIRQKENAKDFPYLQYKTAGDARVRPEHAALDGKIFRIDDPSWHGIYPPNGYNCRCEMIQLASAGKKVSTMEDAQQALGEQFDKIRQSGFLVNRGELMEVFTQNQFYSAQLKDVPKLNLDDLSIDDNAVNAWKTIQQSDLRELTTAEKSGAELEQFFEDRKKKDVKGNEFIVFNDYNGRSLLLYKNEFKKNLKRGDLLEQLGDVLKNPDEVYFSQLKKNAFSYRYFKFFKGKSLVTEIALDRNTGMSIMEWKEAAEPDSMRKGLLIKKSK